MSATASAFASPNAVIGKTVVIKGDIRSREPLTIEGQVDGRIEMNEHLLTVAAGATVRAHISGHDVEVRGRVEGQVEATATVYIRKDAEFIGDIYASNLIVEDGSYIKGNIDLTRGGPFESSFETAEALGDLSDAVLSS
jgi:cytoskeletal protein CcmA (bactofilin family)